MPDNLRILHLEDLPYDAELVELTLRRSGLKFVVEHVDNEVALRDGLERFKPDIVLSDYNLPGFDGMAALEIIRKADATLPFIFVSGMIGEDRAIAALKQGATDYVLKSNLSRLSTAVTRAISELATEKARQDAEAQLLASERRLRDIIDTSQDWIWEMDAEGRYTFCSGAVRHILGFEPDVLIGRTATDFMHPDDVWRAPMLLPAPDATRSVNGVNSRWLHRDGSLRWLERSAIHLMRGGTLVGYRGNDRDITLRMQHEVHIARLNRVHSLLSSVNATVAKADDCDRMLHEICRLAVDRGGYLRVVIGLPAEQGSTVLRPIAWKSSLDDPLRTLGLSFSGGDLAEHRNLVDEALAFLKPAVCDDLRDDSSRPICHRLELSQAGVRAIAAIPMLVDGKAVGAIVFESGEAGVYDNSELELLEDIATDVGFALQYFEKDEALQFLSRFDALTHLARRELFCDRIARTISTSESTEQIAVLTLELDHIGFVNDSYGHEFGDQLLRATSARLRARVGDSDRLAHLGNGTFAMYLAGSQALDSEIGHSREFIRSVFNDSFEVAGKEININIRTGLSIYPKDAASPMELLQHAETALRRAKEVEATDIDYSGSINEEVAARLQLIQSLHRALEQDQFVLHYQPQVDIRTGKVLGAEALLRWNDPDRGLQMPDKFISVLEHSGGIIDVGYWVIRQAMRDSQELFKLGHGNLRVAVNISPLQLNQPEFVPNVLALSLEFGDKRPQLEVEITESVLVRDVEASIEKLRALREFGVRVSMDDFGTGYSSLSLLSRLPIDTLKVDRSFVRAIGTDANAATVVTTIMNLARSLRLETVAEGIETEEQLRLLQLVNCDIGQGWLFGKAVPFQAFKAMLEKQGHAPRNRGPGVSGWSLDTPDL
jgi:diguanylate cyclase (GGDEF)-like protein/PAS domain S-box-containing protein